MHSIALGHPLNSALARPILSRCCAQQILIQQRCSFLISNHSGLLPCERRHTPWILIQSHSEENIMMAGIRNILSAKYHLMLSILIIVMCSGYFLVYLRFAKPRGFKGDFYTAMYDPNWWDGNWIFYSPIFVIERWIVNSLPSLATIEMFAFSCLGLLVSSLLIILKIVHADRVFTIFCIVIWTFNTYFYYSFSVAANPEILELVFLSIAWWCLSTERYPLTWFVVTCAVLTKSVPIIFAPLLLLFFSWGGLVISVVTTASVLAIVSFGQKQSIFQVSLK